MTNTCRLQNKKYYLESHDTLGKYHPCKSGINKYRIIKYINNSYRTLEVH